MLPPTLAPPPPPPPSHARRRGVSEMAPSQAAADALEGGRATTTRGAARTRRDAEKPPMSDAVSCEDALAADSLSETGASTAGRRVSLGVGGGVSRAPLALGSSGSFCCLGECTSTCPNSRASKASSHATQRPLCGEVPLAATLRSRARRRMQRSTAAQTGHSSRAASAASTGPCPNSCIISAVHFLRVRVTFTGSTVAELRAAAQVPEGKPCTAARASSAGASAAESALGDCSVLRTCTASAAAEEAATASVQGAGAQTAMASSSTDAVLAL